MTCDRYLELFSTEIDGELTDTEMSELQAHQAECPACRKEMDAMWHANERLTAFRVPGQPAGLGSKIRQQLGFSDQAECPASWHMGIIPERPGISPRTDDHKPAFAPMTMPWGRA